MTEALSQNLENNLEAAFEMLNVSTALSTDASQTTDGEAFSNLINTISANLEQVQSEFETLAADGVLLDSSVKSNISSINQFVLEDKTLELESGLESDPQVITFNDVNLDNINPDNEILSEVQDDTSFELKEPEIAIQEVEARIADNTKETPIEAVVDTKEIEKQQTTTLEEKPEIKIEQKAQEIIIANFDILNQNKDLDTIKDSINEDGEISLDSIEKIDNSIDNVLNLLEVSKLPLEQKNKIKEAFNSIKEKISAIKENSASFKEINLDEAKKILDGVVLKVVSNKTKTNDQAPIEDSIDTQDIKEIQQEAQTVVSNVTDEAPKEASADNNKAPQEVSEKIDEIVLNKEKQQPIEIETVETVENDNFETKEAETLTFNNDGKEENETVELKKLNDEIKQLLDNIDLDNLDNLENLQKDTKKLNELLSRFKNNQTLTDDDKIEVGKIIEKINNLTSNKTSLEALSKEIKALNLNKTDKITLDDSLEIEAPKAEISAETNIETKKETKTLDKIIKDLKVEINPKESRIPLISGALSVNDEVAKMALNEETSSVLSATDAPIQANIMYDNGVVKNNSIQLKDIPTPKFNLEEHNVMNQITNKITELKGSEGHKLTLVLRPNDLGRVSIELKTDANGLTTHIVAQNAEVRNFIEKNIHNLRQSLADSGVNVNNIQIKTAGEAEASTYEGNKDFNQQQQEQQEQSQNKNQNQKEKRETLQAFSDFETHFKKDFSSVLNKTISYNLN